MVGAWCAYLRLQLQRLDPLLDLVQERQALHELDGGCRLKLKLKLSVLQLGNQSVHLFTRLHRQNVIDDVETAVRRRNHQALHLDGVNEKHAQWVALNDALGHLNLLAVVLQRFREERYICNKASTETANLLLEIMVKDGIPPNLFFF